MGPTVLTWQAGFYLGADKAQEMRTLRSQAAQSQGKGGAYAAVLNLLIEALDVCLAKEKANYSFDHDLHGFGGTASEGIHFFESIVVHLSRDFPKLEESSFEGFDATVEGAGYP